MSCTVDAMASVFIFLSAELWTRDTRHHGIVGAMGGGKAGAPKAALG